MNFEQNQHIRAKGRGIFYLLLLAAIAMSALIGACNNVSGNGDSMTLNLSYPAIIGTPGTAITETNPTWSSTPEGVVVYAIEPALPAGLYMELGTGIITGTPTAATEGEYTITAVFISSGTKTEKTATISITIKDISDFTDAEKVAADKADLDITSAVGGDLALIKQDFTLPITGAKGTAISWKVDSGTAIILSGTSGESAAVTRPGLSETDNTVVLRATITLGAESDTKDFSLTVKKLVDLTDEQAVAQDKSDLSADSFQFAQGDAYNQVTQDFTLPTTGGEGSTISWTITSGTAISLSGTNNAAAAVTRPNYVDGDADVVLEAAIVRNSASDTKTFTLTVIKMTLNLSYPAIAGTTGTAITETSPKWSSTPEGNVVYAIEPDLPADLYMEPDTGIISGTPTAATEGEYTITAVFISSSTRTEKTATISITITALTDADKVAADKADLDITSAVGGDLTAVKLDFTLPTTGQKGTAISWEVSSGTAIALSGTSGESAAVTRPGILETDAEVVLKASITLGTESDTKDFTLTVKKQEDLTDEQAVAQDKSDLSANSFQFAQGDLYNQVTQDFTLPTTGGEGSTISWSITSGTAISLSGTNSEMAAVTRPNPVDGDANVELTAAIAKNSASDTKTFTLTVIKKDQVDIASLDSSEFSLTVDDTNATALTEKTHSVTVGGSLSLAAGTDYDLSITGSGVSSGAVSIANNGSITMTSAIVMSDGGDYTVTATGKGNYTGMVSDTFTLTVDAKSLTDTDFTLTVDNTSVTVSTGGSHTAAVGGSLIAGTDYGLSITAAGSGAVSIANDGRITMTSAIALSDAGDYTVTATGTGNYAGTVSDTFTLTVSAQPVLGEITYANGDFTLDVQITPLSPSGTNSAQATYAMKTGESLPTGLSLAADGTISGTPTVGSPQTTYTIEATGKTGTVYAGEVKPISILISVDNDLASFFDFSLSPTTQTVTKNGQNEMMTLTIVSNDRGFTAGTEYTWATKRSDGSTPGFMMVGSSTVTIIASSIPGSSAEGTYMVIATGQGRYSGEVTKEFVLDLPADALPGAPAITSITPEDSKLVVNWSAPADTGYYDAAVGEISGYTVYWDTSSGVSKSSANKQTTGAAATSYEISGLSNNQIYHVIVTATTGAGEGNASTAVSGTPVPDDALPGAPTITGIVPGYEKLVISWSAPTDKGYFNGSEGVISGYTVYWDTSSGVSTGSTTKQTVQDPATSYEISGLTNGQIYYVIVTAVTDAGEGPASTEDSGTPVANAPPGAPTITSMTSDNAANIILTWAAPIDTGYINGDGTQGVITTYKVYYINESTRSNSDDSWEKSDADYHEVIDDESLTTWSMFFSDGYSSGETVHLKMTATNAFGESELSNEDSSTVTKPDDAVPGAPTEVTATAGDGKVTISGTAPDNEGFNNGNYGYSSYTVYYDTKPIDASSLPTNKVEVPRAKYSYTMTEDVTGLINGTKYYFRVTATNATGESPPSEEATATPTL